MRMYMYVCCREIDVEEGPSTCPNSAEEATYMYTGTRPKIQRCTEANGMLTKSSCVRREGDLELSLHDARGLRAWLGLIDVHTTLLRDSDVGTRLLNCTFECSCVRCEKVVPPGLSLYLEKLRVHASEMCSVRCMHCGKGVRRRRSTTTEFVGRTRGVRFAEHEVRTLLHATGALLSHGIMYNSIPVISKVYGRSEFVQNILVV